MLNELQVELGPDIDLEELIDALYILRVPRSLTAIIPICREFRDWRERFPALATLDGVARYRQRLKLLDRIADLDAVSEVLTGEVLGRSRGSVLTPLRPYTGDSVIGELLLIRSRAEAYSRQFHHLCAWLIWQVQRFHVRTIRRESYKRYLLEEGPRLLEQGHGSRIYNAYLALRNLAEEANREKLASLHGMRLTLSHQRSLELTLLSRLARLSDGTESRRLKRHAAEKLGFDESRLGDEINALEAVMPPALSLLLTTVWGDELNLRAGVRKSGGGGGGTRRVVRPEIRRGRHLTEMLLRVDDDDLHAGTVVDFYARDDDADFGVDDRSEVDDDPEEEEQKEPLFSLFLADGAEPIKGYYGAKAMQAAIEYQNAQLPWARSTLSRQALDVVLAAISQPEEADETPTGKQARLAIGLSLLTGRSLEETALPEIGGETTEATKTSPIIISKNPHRLHVYCGRPVLRAEATPPPVCYPSAYSISLPLPTEWSALIDWVAHHPAHKLAEVVRSARRLLRSFPFELRITEKGLRYAFIRALAEITRGDLGAQKAITDGTEANTQNVIHYASYSARELATWWKKAAEIVLGSSLPTEPIQQKDQTENARVGTQHAFELTALSEYIADIKQRIRNAEGAGDWVRAYNLLTLYLVYWLGLGTAGRKTRSPVPRIILAGSWVLVSDKHRSDGSTDRLIPLTDGLLRQIDIYLSLASELAVLLPELDPLVQTEAGTSIRLQYIQHDGTVVPYQPKYQESDEQLTALPANFGRKLFRSETTHMPGRYRDAELGHFARGRHAWHIVSSLDSRDFRSQMLSRQTQLEDELGFELLAVGGNWQRSRRPPRMPAKSVRTANTVKCPEEKPIPDIEPYLEAASPAHYERLMDQSRPCEPGVALELVRKLAAAHSKSSPEQLVRLAKSACEFIRTQRKIPLFAERPRPLFANRFVLNTAGLQTLDYLQVHVLEAFQKDLEILPTRLNLFGEKDAVVAARTRTELGRLLMIGIWRLGLTRWSLLDAWLKALHAGMEILAVGQARYQILQVTSELSREPMQRTVCLDAFSSSYLTIEKSSIQNDLLPGIYGQTPGVNQVSRRARAEAAINSYLKSIGAGQHRVTLSAMTEAAAQRIMSESAPVVAAYARGELMTEDLGDPDLRRLAGLNPVRRAGRSASSELPAFKEYELEDGDIPDDIVAYGAPFLRALIGPLYDDIQQWQGAIAAQPVETPAERLLQAFALWLLPRQKAADEESWEVYGRRYLRNRLRVVATMLLGYTSSGPYWSYIDESVIAALAEISREHFPDRLQHGAWFQFHAFLTDKSADHAGFAVGPLGPPPVRAVSAKIMCEDEIEQLLDLLLSARSGIGNAALRISARRHIELMATFGLRRGESSALRSLDYQRNMIRVQAYGDHTLKTAWAERTLPLAFAEPETRAWMRQASNQKYGLLIDPDESTAANPDNFYDAVNRLIKKVTGDDSLSSHHLRHALASRLTATLLHDAGNLEQISDEFPWVERLPLSRDRIAALLGSEGNAGQGLQAVSGLIGHSHATTTIRYYVHILCLALFGALRGLDKLNMSRSFERRFMSLATMQRWSRSARETAEAIEPDQRRQEINRALRDMIELKLEDAGISRDETPNDPLLLAEDSTEGSTDERISFDHLELIDRSLRDGRPLLGTDAIDGSRYGLSQLASLKSGKRGAAALRHDLAEISDGVWLPPPLAAGTATQAAATLCDWLSSLRHEQPDDFRWLLEKWTLASSRDRGYIRLDDTGEQLRIQAMANDDQVTIELATPKTAADKRVRIKCIDPSSSKVIVRDTIAVRWVMSHVAAIQLAAEEVSTSLA